MCRAKQSRALKVLLTITSTSTTGEGLDVLRTVVREVTLVHRPVVIEDQVQVGQSVHLHRREVAVVAIRVIARAPEKHLIIVCFSGCFPEGFANSWIRGRMTL